jgi:uncharacterized ferritin-like protein (DUF455 family)
MSSTASIVGSLRHQALEALSSCDVTVKLSLTQALNERISHFVLLNDDATVCTTGMIVPTATLPGRPSLPELRAHLDVPQRSIHTPLGLAALTHSVSHIEFNAINLALDAVWRFDQMPLHYYTQWITVAAEEAHHFSLLRAQLQSMGYDYGDFVAHTGLWDMTERTQGDIVARMALVPRLLEARGLDATPPMQAKLRKVGTPDALKIIAILDIILRDEVGHVRIGNHWYRWLCARVGLDPVSHFRLLCAEHAAPRLRPPLNEEARRLAGFTDVELAELLSK